MSRKSKKRRDLERLAEQEARPSESVCRDRAAHWTSIIIFGECGKCGKELAPFGI